jgi:cell division transport system permease protein
MTLWQALRYFVREAVDSLVRSWQAGAIAVFTVAISLYVSGAFLLATGNLSRAAEDWQRELRVVAYLQPGLEPEAIDPELRGTLEEPEWVAGWLGVSQAEAASRFQESFPDLAGALGETPLPASLEIAIAATASEAQVSEWQATLAAHPMVSMVDDDRDWLRTMGRLVVLVRGVGIAVGLGLLVAAALTTASVVRLAAYQYLEEIGVLRLVGATEFFIRGPFYVQGLLQGVLGGLIALALLAVSQQLVLARASESLWLSLVAGNFLDAKESLVMIGIGAGAGLVGALASLRKESLRSDEA